MGHIENAKWLLSLEDERGTIDIHEGDDHAFRMSRRLDVLKWLWKLVQDEPERGQFNLYIHDNELFRMNTNRYYIDNVIWLQSICPKFQVEIKDGKIIKWSVNGVRYNVD